MIKNLPPGLLNILIIMGLFGLAQISLGNVGFNVNQLYLYYPDSPNFRFWQIITHMFCHGGFGHFFFNAFALFSFGMIVEYRLGTARFLKLFFISGLGAVLIHFAYAASVIYEMTGSLMPMHKYGQMGYDYILNIHQGPVLSQSKINQLMGLNFGPMLGASGAIYGVMTAFAVLYPNETLIFLFIPYPIKAKYLVPGLILIDIILGLTNASNDPIAHFAHIGGAMTGYLLIKFWQRKVRHL